MKQIVLVMMNEKDYKVEQREDGTMTSVTRANSASVLLCLSAVTGEWAKNVNKTHWT